MLLYLAVVLIYALANPTTTPWRLVNTVPHSTRILKGLNIPKPSVCIRKHVVLPHNFEMLYIFFTNVCGYLECLGLSIWRIPSQKQLLIFPCGDVIQIWNTIFLSVNHLQAIVHHMIILEGFR